LGIHDGVVWVGFFWLGIGTSGWLFVNNKMSFQFPYKGTPYQMALWRTCRQVGPGKKDARRDSLEPEAGREE
jgi:hypothetical protein